MRPSFVFIASVVAFICTGAADPAGNAERLKVDAVFARYSTAKEPGCAAGVIREGSFVHLAGYGAADLVSGRRIDANTVFDIASVSKQFTAFSVLLLEKDGRLSLEDPVRKFVPELPAYADKVKVRHLVYHLGGLRDYAGLLLLSGRKLSDLTGRDEALAMLASQLGPDDEPGKRFTYSNTGYFLLSLVVERASGRTLADFSRERIFAPLGMTHTVIVDHYPVSIDGLATGYTLKGGVATPEDVRWSQTGPGQVYTTVGDLALWDANFYTGAVGGKDVVDVMVRHGWLDDGKTIFYGAGLNLSSYGGLRTQSHLGDWAGFRSQVMRFPDQRLTVIALCNRRDAPVTEMAARVAKLFLGDAYDAAAADPHDLDKMKGLLGPEEIPEGTYRNDAGHYLRIERRDGKLVVVMWKKAYEPELTAQQNVFKVDLGARSAQIAFTRDSEGVERMYFQRNNDALVYTREELWVPDMASYAGDYVADECGAHVNLRWDGSQLVSDDFGDPQVFVPGIKGELVGIDPMVLRVPVDGSTSSFASGRPGFKGLIFRRVGRQ